MTDEIEPPKNYRGTRCPRQYCDICAKFGEKRQTYSMRGDVAMCHSHCVRERRGASGERLWSPIGHSRVGPKPAEQTIADPPSDDLDRRLAEQLLKSKAAVRIEALADKFNLPPRDIRASIARLTAAGRNISIAGDEIRLSRSMPSAAAQSRIDIKRLDGQRVLIGLTADNHLCSRYARNEVLEALYDIWQSQGVRTVYQAGNFIDGEARFNKFDLVVRPGIEAQAEYFFEHWPRREGMETYLVAGDDHEGWYVQTIGINVCTYFQAAAARAGRDDLKFLDYMEHDVVFRAAKGEAIMRVMHAGGGSAYALSYSVQKIIESLSGGEKPAIMLIGHFHKAEYLYMRNVHAVQAASTMDQSPWLRKKRIQSTVGGWTIEFSVDDHGAVHHFKPEFHNFFDSEYYRQWGYIWKPERGKECTV